METMQPAPVEAGSFDDLMEGIDRDGVDQTPPTVGPSPPAAIDLTFPEPLRSYLGSDALKWRRLGSAHQVKVPTGDRSTTVRLLKIRGGQPMPVHGHRGLELTLVLKGSFHDAHGTFARGDIEEADEDIEHQPVASPGEECICLAVTDAPLRFRGLAALLQPFLRI